MFKCVNNFNLFKNNLINNNKMNNPTLIEDFSEWLRKMDQEKQTIESLKEENKRLKLDNENLKKECKKLSDNLQKLLTEIIEGNQDLQ